MKSKTNAMQKIWTVGVASDFCVVGHNYEMADYDNPRGEIVRERFYLLATDEKGNRKSFGYFETEEDAEVCFWSSPVLPEVEAWDEDRPEYGSEAYVAYGQYEDVELEKREAQDEAWGLR